ncbi:MAG: ribosome recycling factor [Calditrichaeota bacterium]|nr:ribosome recycling factor [Calditrichota bacterium]MBT7787953.1 ribosome recycling factor [Calditrichota bacterium]
MSDTPKEATAKMEKAVAHTRDEMMRLRTGKATPTLLDTIKVDYYGNLTPLKQIASIAAPEARLLVVSPFDASALSNIEKAIQASDLGFNPQNDGRIIRIPVPVLTTERREEIIKIIKRFAEDGRVSIRNIRRDANEQLKTAEKDKQISEDEMRRMQDVVQKETNKFTAEIDLLLKNRESEIRSE